MLGFFENFEYFAPNINQKLATFFVTVLRALFYCAFIFILDNLNELGTAPLLISLGTTVTIIMASFLAFSNLSQRGFISLLFITLLLYKFLVFIGLNIPLPEAYILKSYVVKTHFDLVLGASLLASTITWYSWKFRLVAALEAIVLTATFISALSGHRDYRFDMIEQINSLAWELGVSQLSMLTALGAIIFLVMMSFLYLSSLPARPIPNFKFLPEQLEISKKSPFLASLFVLAGFILVFVISNAVYNFHYTTAQKSLRNGVGDEAKEGLSPLTFQSALGGSNQPAAVVRLEGDYADNPYSPMLYMREQALSQLKGNQLVAAAIDVNPDINRTHPMESYKSEKISTLLEHRTTLTQSVFLLTEHNLAFAVDYPLSIVGLKNPEKTNRFKSSYRAYSFAPSFNLTDIADAAVGSDSWTDAERQHFLETHSDPRYADLARQITTNEAYPVLKALALNKYISKNAIYTLKPNHDVKPDEDPTAPFLFGDKRGYCVHFAHAMSYMLRALDIPARVATGYLTDLSQAKDGHILLRMSDRHAWAEIYVKNYGWVPIDPQPEQVESHAETPVDMALLEELMGLLDPGEEMLPNDIAKDEKGMSKPENLTLPNSKQVIWFISLLILLFFAVKIYFRYSWVLPAKPEIQLKRRYRALLVILYDFGLKRNHSETRQEFRKRLQTELGLDLLSLTEPLEFCNYGSTEQIESAIRQMEAYFISDKASLKTLPTTKQLITLLDPRSTILCLGGKKW